MLKDPTPYSEIAQSPRFRALLSRKKQFLIPLSVFFFVFYFALPVMTSYLPEVMNHRAVGVITWAWLFAFSQFVMIWTLCGLYVKKAETFDTDAAEVIQEETGGRGA